MSNLGVLALLPLWAFGLLALGILLGSLELGFLLGRRDQEREARSGQITTLQAATLGLLALVLSFTYSYTNGRMDERKHSVTMEANAIGTAYLRAGYLSGPQGERLRSLLEDYARIRIVTDETTDTPEKLQNLITRSTSLHGEIWAVMQDIMRGNAGPKEVALLQPVNDIIDLHTVRLTVGFDRLPGIVMSMLLLVAALSMFLTGYNAVVSGKKNRWITMALASVLSFLIFVIADLDRGLEGFVQVSQQPFATLIASMGE